MKMWSDLPYDILAIICKPLTIPDIFSFASVCRSWRSAAALDDTKEHLFRFNLQKPWLLFSGGQSKVENCYTISDNRVNFYSISDNRFFARGPLPMNNLYLLGSDYGWIIAADDTSELLLLNPVTLQKIYLPPTSTFDHVTPLFKNNESNNIITHYHLDSLDGENLIYQIRGVHTVEEFRYFLYWKACLSCSPSMNDHYTVVVYLFLCKCFAFAKSGDTKWTIVYDAERPLLQVDMVLHHNDHVSMLHFINYWGKMMSCDLNSDQIELTSTLPSREWDSHNNIFYNNNFYLIYSPWGDLLYIRRVRNVDCPKYSTIKIEVYRVNLKSMTLVKVENLGQYALFVGVSNPICISVEDSPLLKENCVYFTEDFIFALNTQSDNGIYDLSDGSVEFILPNDPRLFWPAPIWFTPSLL